MGFTMAGEDRPQGRKKQVGSGGGGLFKTGSGLGGRTGGPVGEADGYAERREGTAVRDAAGAGGGGRPLGGGVQSGGGSTGGSGLGGLGGGRAPGLGCSPKLLLAAIVIIAIIAVIIYLFSRGGGGGALDGSTAPTDGGFSSPTTTASAVSSTVDTGGTPVVTQVAQAARAKRTVLKGGGNDTVTVMVYMCATDLESQSGMATADLNEMLYAADSDKLNIVIETGGCIGWRNSVISSNSNQRYFVTPQGLQLLEGNLGKRSMVDPATLADFVRYSKANYPADRYMLVFWDHGGGSLAGFGYDQHFKGDSMTLSEIGAGLRDGGCAFDLIGFDACLMATLETAIVLEPYADYMLASEETEPGIGWYHTGWVTALAQNSSLPTTELGKRLIDDYLAQCRTQVPQAQATLSLIDLAELKGTVPSAFADFARSTDGLIGQDSFKAVSDARADAKEFSSRSQLNQIDLIDFAENLGTPEARTLAGVLRGCIKYNRTSTNITNSNGVSIYFPHSRFSSLNAALAEYQAIGLPAQYGECIRSYASLAAGGQVTSGGSGNMLESLLGGFLGGAGGQGASAGSSGSAGLEQLLGAFLGGGDFGRITGGGKDWLDTDRMQASLDYYAANRFDVSALALKEKDGQRVVSLSDDQWDLIQFMEMNVFVDDGEGFIDLGLDNVYEYNSDGDLVMEYDGTWLALNGQIVSYYMVSDDQQGESHTIKGRVPASFNGQLVDIMIVFDDANPGGMVLGAQPRYDADLEADTVAKEGFLQIVAGDKIDFLCDYYTYDGDYTDTYYLGEHYTATGQWKVENLPIGDVGYQMTYRFTDIYGNHYWTQPVSD